MPTTSQRPKQFNGPVDERRVREMSIAVELDVDREEFVFRSEAERVVWLELEAEFLDRSEREGRTWVALQAA